MYAPSSGRSADLVRAVTTREHANTDPPADSPRIRNRAEGSELLSLLFSMLRLDLCARLLSCCAFCKAHSDDCRGGRLIVARSDDKSPEVRVQQQPAIATARWVSKRRASINERSLKVAALSADRRVG